MAWEGEIEHAHVVENEPKANEVHDGEEPAYLRRTARDRRNVFEAVIEAVKTR